MNRKIVNKIRFVFEELLPPIIRDSIIFKYIVKYFYRSDKEHETLKENILNFTDEQYTKYYKAMPEIQGETDNSEDCINYINKKIVPKILKKPINAKIAIPVQSANPLSCTYLGT